MAKNPKIAIVLSNFEQSGVTSNTIDLCIGLKKIGQDVTLIVGEPKTAYQLEKADLLKKQGIKLRYIPSLDRRLSKRIRTFFGLAKEILAGQYDILHLESIYLSIIPKLLGKKFIVTYHSFGLPKNIFAPKATRLISISKGITEDAINRHGYKPNEIDIVLHGVSERFADEYNLKQKNLIKERLGIPENKITIGIVASIESRKGHQFLLEAISKLTPSQRNLVHIIICGNYRNDGSPEWLKTQLEKYDLVNQTTILPFQDPIDIYHILDIFCLPSIWEGFALTVIEAMLSGCCVIRSNVQGSEEQIRQGENGFTFISENPISLKNILSTLIDNPTKIKKIGQTARKDALARFTLTKMAENTLNVYRKLL